MNKKLSFIIISIIILSFLLRIYGLGGESIWLDEGHSILISKRPILSIMTGTDPNPPLYYIILHVWIRLFGDSEFSIRFPSVIFGILSVYVICKLGELIFDSKVGLLSAFILSISLYHIQYSQEARQYSLLVLLILLSNYYFIKILREDKERKYIINYIIFSTMMIYTHIYGLFYLISQNVYYLIYRRNIKLWITIQGAVLSVFMLWIPSLFRRIDVFMTSKDIMGNDFKIIPSYNSVYLTFKAFAGDEYILYIFITVITIGLMIKGYKKDIKNVDSYIFIVLWLFLPIIISSIISYTTNRPLYLTRYVIASLPALALLVSTGLSSLKKIFIIPILLIIMVLQIPLIEGYYQDVDREQWRDAANYIKDARTDDDIILLYPNSIKIPFSYYYKDLDYIGINNSFEIKNVIKNHDRIWLIFSHLQYGERRKESFLIEDELSKLYTMKDVIKFHNIDVHFYTKDISVIKKEEK